MGRRFCMRAAGCLLLILAGAASAEPIRFTFRGVLNDVSGPVAPPPDVFLGAAYEASFVFDSGAVDGNGAANSGAYDQQLNSQWVRIGAFAVNGGDGDITILNNGFAGDTYNATWGTVNEHVQLGLTDLTGAVFASDALPQSLDLSRFAVRGFSLHVVVGPAYWQVGGTVAAFEGGPAPTCTADYNDDGGADNADIIDLASDIASGTQSFPPHTSDFNNDGGADNSDVIDLANTVAGGACPP